MQDKLQELTDRLYNEGLAKGKAEAEELKEGAKAEAGRIISEARKEAGNIIAAARKEAEDIKAKSANDIKMASENTVSALRQRIEGCILTQALSAPIGKALSDEDFIKSIITTLAEAFKAGNPEAVGLEAVLPEKTGSELIGFIRGKISEIMGKGVEISLSPHINAGFRIGPKEQGYLISFSDEDFMRIFASYLRPVTKKILFGEKA
ncbi:MAG TPA: hypothetical protein IAC34_06390 [Candidatus Coprenecus stercoripullorum]|nr:hypothetical protein [Candidatus Coprenecus stercoripullorum]